MKKDFRLLKKFFRFLGDAMIVIAFVAFIVFVFTVGTLLLMELAY